MIDPRSDGEVWGREGERKEQGREGAEKEKGKELSWRYNSPLFVHTQVALERH